VLAGPALTYLASTSASLTDPAGSSVLVAAVAWLQQTVLGTVATTIAVIAVASVGFSMLNGRVSVRYGMTVVIGCFILLGASTIAAGIQSFVGGGDGVSYAPEPPPPAVLPPPPPSSPPAPVNNDPYAGASVPSR
jgi:type IV secretory pathway VirB2 component (pilin)